MWFTVLLTGRQIQASCATRGRSTHPSSAQPTTTELEANLKCLMNSATSPGSRKMYEQAWNHFLDFPPDTVAQLCHSFHWVSVISYFLWAIYRPRNWHLLPFRLTFPHWAIFIKLDLSLIPPKHLLYTRSWLLKAGSARNRTYGCLSLALSYINWCRL